MKHNQLLKDIAAYLTGIEMTVMTVSEKHIVHLLIKNGFLRVNNRNETETAS